MESPIPPPFSPTRFRLASGSGNVALHFSMSAFIILDAQPPPLYHPHPRTSPSTSISQGENVKKERKTKRSKKEELQMEKTSRQGIRN